MKSEKKALQITVKPPKSRTYYMVIRKKSPVKKGFFNMLQYKQFKRLVLKAIKRIFVENVLTEANLVQQVHLVDRVILKWLTSIGQKK